jgi:hypothetical protein
MSVVETEAVAEETEAVVVAEAMTDAVAKVAVVEQDAVVAVPVVTVAEKETDN